MLIIFLKKNNLTDLSKGKYLLLGRKLFLLTVLTC